MSKEVSEIIKSIFGILDKDAREMISVFVAVLAPMALMFGFFFAFMWGMNFLDSLDTPTEKCWNAQEIKGEIFSVNECTGEVKKLRAENESTTEEKSKKPVSGNEGNNEKANKAAQPGRS